MNTEERYQDNLLYAELDKIDLSPEEEKRLDKIKQESLKTLVRSWLGDISHDETEHALIKNEGKWKDLTSAVLPLLDRGFELATNDECKHVTFLVLIFIRDVMGDMIENNGHLTE